MKKLTWKQQVFTAAMFVLIWGVVGKIDYDSQQALIDERVAIRDLVKEQTEEAERKAYAYFDEVYNGAPALGSTSKR